MLFSFYEKENYNNTSFINIPNYLSISRKLLSSLY